MLPTSASMTSSVETLTVASVRVHLARIATLPKMAAQVRFQSLLESILESSDFDLDMVLETELERVKEDLGL